MDIVCVCDGEWSERTSRQEDPFCCAEALQGTDERLDGFASDVAALLVPLRLNVDSVKSESILVDNTIDTSVARPTDTGSALLGASVAHGEEQMDDGLFKEVRVAIPEPREQLDADLIFDAADAVSDLFNRVKDVYGILNIRLELRSPLAASALWPERSEDSLAQGVIEATGVLCESFMALVRNGVMGSRRSGDPARFCEVADGPANPLLIPKTA